VSDDVSLGRPARPLTWTPVRPEEPPTARGWEIYFGVCLAGVGVFTLTDNSDPVAQRSIVLGLLAAMGVWYLVVGRRAVLMRRQTWRGWLFQSVLLSMFVVATALVGSSTFLLFALCPLAYMTLRTRSAHPVIVAYAFTPAVLLLLTEGPHTLGVTLPLGAIVTTISVVTAVTTQRIEHTSGERARLIEELEASRAEVARLSREAGIAEERGRLAGDIHDTVAQGLSSVVMLVEAADAVLTRDPEAARGHLALAARTARENLAETRAIVAALTPVPLAEATLADALRRLADRFDGEVGVPAELNVVGPARPLTTSIEVVLLRVAQEALTNAGKHAKASSVALELAYGTDHIVLSIVDDGIGFDPAALAPGYGLGAMRTRVEQIGGRLTIDSVAGTGTTIRASVTQ
jgi:signal transduction histidine kinase